MFPHIYYIDNILLHIPIYILHISYAIVSSLLHLYILLVTSGENPILVTSGENPNVTLFGIIKYIYIIK